MSRGGPLPTVCAAWYVGIAAAARPRTRSDGRAFFVCPSCESVERDHRRESRIRTTCRNSRVPDPRSLASSIWLSRAAPYERIYNQSSARRDGARDTCPSPPKVFRSTSTSRGTPKVLVDNRATPCINSEASEMTWPPLLYASSTSWSCSGNTSPRPSPRSARSSRTAQPQHGGNVVMNLRTKTRSTSRGGPRIPVSGERRA